MSDARLPPPNFGEPARFFTAETDGVPRYSIEVAAGRFMVLMIFGTLADPRSYAAHQAVLAEAGLFNDTDAVFYGVSGDARDRTEHGAVNAPFGLRYFRDYEHRIARLYGVASDTHLQPAVFLIDRAFRILMAESIEDTPLVLDRLKAELAGEPPLEASPFAPVLVLPRIFEPEFCANLISYFQSGEAKESGFAIDIDGRTVEVVHATLKRRQDVTIEDEGLLAGVESRLRERLFPMIQRAFNWRATHIERFLICRYSEADQGFFFPHRDDATAGSAHRKFAVTINLNAGFEGGELRFPEFGARTYRPSAGGACVFCCSLLHEATPVTKGVRYAVVPFLYDDDGAATREANAGLVG
jgi:predicted 2-oxoglutarate/Fe(II)-dependent dioxygenase YbiX/peroxiredoxin